MDYKKQLRKIVKDHRGIHPVLKQTLLSDIGVFTDAEECEAYIKHHVSEAETMTNYKHYKQEGKSLIPDFIKRIEGKALKDCNIAILEFPEDIE